MLLPDDGRSESIWRAGKFLFVPTTNACPSVRNCLQHQRQRRQSCSPSIRIYSTAPATISSLENDLPKSPRVSIDYCTGCRWGLRAGWMAQELLQTFGNSLGEVSIRPSDNSGTFNVWIDGQLIWCRKREGGFPELKEVKQRIRDVINPDMSLGHSDKAQDKTPR